MSVVASHWVMAEVEVTVGSTLHWHVCVSTAPETDKARIQEQISRCGKNERHPKYNAPSCQLANFSG